MPRELSGLDARSQARLRRLAEASPKPALRKSLVKSTAPIQSTVRKAVRALPSGRSRLNTPGGSLRNAVASAVVRRVKISAADVAIFIQVLPKGGKSNLARVLEGDLLWVHPTFGHGPEVTQEPEPYFYETIDKQLPAINVELSRALKEFERTL